MRFWEVSQLRHRVLKLFALISPAFFAGMLSVLKGLDSNYDLLDYHLANGWSFRRGIPSNWFLTGVSSYHPKWFDFLYYISMTKTSTSIHSFLWGFFGGLTFVFCLLLTKGFIKLSYIETCLVVGLAIFNPLIQSEIGTSLGDLTVSSLVLGGFTLGYLSKRSKVIYFGFALLIVGTLSKISLAPFGIALFFLLVFAKRNSFRKRNLVLTALVACYICSGVYIKSYRETGTPNLLVDFGGIFKPIAVWPDVRFRPHGFANYIKYLFSAGGIPGKNMELAYFDCLTPMFTLILLLTLPMLYKKKFIEICVLELTIFSAYGFQTYFSGNLRYSVLFVAIIPFLCFINLKLLKQSVPVLVNTAGFVVIFAVFLQVLPFNTFYLPTKGPISVPKILDWGHTNNSMGHFDFPYAKRKSLIITIDPTTSQFAALWDLPPNTVEWRGAYQYIVDSPELKKRLLSTIQQYREFEIYGLFESPSITNASDRLRQLGLTAQQCQDLQTPFHNYWARAWQICKLRETQ